MKIILCLLALILVPCLAPAADESAPELLELIESVQSSAVGLDRLMKEIRDGRAGGAAARTPLIRLLDEAARQYYRSGGGDAPRSSWVFPVAGRDVRAITGGRRHGYRAQGYDFFSGNRHGGHPSLDIFIRDRDQDCSDDGTGEPVSVLSMTAGVVISAEQLWEQGSRLRGGNYLWVYDPGSGLLVYYAHNQRLLVRVGDLVRPGDVIATVGRSGWNAAKRRSPTHLHLTVIDAAGGRFTPVDVYRDLRALSR